MNGRKNWLTYLLIGIITICIPVTVYAQDDIIEIEIAGDKAVISIPPISEGVVAKMDISTEGDFPIKSLTIGAAATIDAFSVTIEILDENPMETKEVNGTVYKYLTVVTENLEPESLANAKIDFRIPKDWLAANNVDMITVGLLGVFEGEWSIQPTQVIEDSVDEVVFSADIPNLSFINYAIAGDIPVVTTTTTTTTIKTIMGNVTTITTTSTPVFTSTVTSVVESSDTIAYIAIGGAAVAVVILLMVSRSSRKGHTPE